MRGHTVWKWVSLSMTRQRKVCKSAMDTALQYMLCYEIIRCCKKNVLSHEPQKKQSNPLNKFEVSEHLNLLWLCPFAALDHMIHVR